MTENRLISPASASVLSHVDSKCPSQQAICGSRLASTHRAFQPQTKKKPLPREAWQGFAIFNHSTLVARVVSAEVEEPPAVIPFERHLPPCQRHLRIGIERTNVRPGG